MADCSLKNDRNSRLSGSIMSSSSSHSDDVSKRNEILLSLSREVLPPERPKRPLSAYNIFFREARRKILHKLPGTRKKSKHTLHYSARSPHGKIGFADLAKTIGAMWKSANAEERNVCNAIALDDRKRYDREMVEWKSIMEKVSNGTIQEDEENPGNHVSSTTIHIDQEDEDHKDFSAGTQETTEEASMQEALSGINEEEVFHETRTVNGTAAGGPIPEANEASLDADNLMNSVMDFMVNKSSSRPEDVVEEPAAPFGDKKRSSNPRANTAHTRPPITTYNTPKNNSAYTTKNPTGAFPVKNSRRGVVPAQASYFLEYNARAGRNEEADPLSPTLTLGFTASYSELTNLMGKDNTAFFINSFQY